MSAFFITGAPGSGKSSVLEELALRGYSTLNTDDMPEITSFYDRATHRRLKHKPTGPFDPKRYAWQWDVDALLQRLIQSPDPTFVAAITSNSDDNFHLFQRVFALKPSLHVLKRRLLTRTTNDFGKQHDELALVLENYEKESAKLDGNGGYCSRRRPPAGQGGRRHYCPH